MINATDYRQMLTPINTIRALQDAWSQGKERNAPVIAIERAEIVPAYKWSDTCVISLTPPVKVIYNNKVTTVLDHNQRTILQRFIAHVSSVCMSDSVTVNSINVDVFDDSEGHTEIICSIDVNAISDIALPFWDRIGSSIEQWLSAQHDSTRRVVREQFAIDVCWQSTSV
jgi:hypothetical protein